MRWLKHFTDVKSESHMKAFINEYGFDGYGKFWHIVEMVAQEMIGNKPPVLEQDIETWMADLKMRRKSCVTFLHDLQRYFCNSQWRIQVKLTEPRDTKEDAYILSRCLTSNELLGQQKKDLLTVAIPKLKYLKDKYTQDQARTAQST